MKFNYCSHTLFFYLILILALRSRVIILLIIKIQPGLGFRELDSHGLSKFFKPLTPFRVGHLANSQRLFALTEGFAFTE